MSSATAAAVAAATLKDNDLATKLGDDVAVHNVPKFHDHVMQALLNGLSDEQIANAIRANESVLKAAWQEEQDKGEGDSPWPGIDEFVANELSREKMYAMFTAGSALDDEDSDDEDTDCDDSDAD